MVKRTHDQTMHETRKDFGGIANRFTATELDIVFIEKQWIATEFMNADLKRNPRAGTGLGENQRPGLLRKRRRRVPTAAFFQTLGQGKNLRDLMGLKVCFLKEVLHVKAKQLSRRRACYE